MWQCSNIFFVVAIFWSPVSSFTTCRSTTVAISSTSSAMFASLDAISDAKLQIEESM